MAMSGLSFNQLCCLFCCPPCPSEIAAKLAFLPPEPTYSIVSDDRGGSRTYSLHLSERAEWQYSQRELDNIEVFLARTERGNQIACMFVRCATDPQYTLLFSHGNAVDLGQMSSFFVALGTRLQCNIFSYDYSGYGMSNGKPSEKNLYADVDCAWHTLRTRFAMTPEQIVLYGQSIGTVPTVDLAARQRCAGVVLHSPLTSGIRVACHGTRRTWCCDPFPSIEKVGRIASPCLVIHGKDDEVIDISHGYAIFERLPTSTRVDALWVDGAGHNDVELYSVYLERLKRFTEVELPALASSGSTSARRMSAPGTNAKGASTPKSGDRTSNHRAVDKRDTNSTNETDSHTSRRTSATKYAQSETESLKKRKSGADTDDSPPTRNGGPPANSSSAY